MEDLEGRQLGQYRIVSRLGEGGMATVYRAYQPRMDRYVAIKVLPRHYATDPTFIGRFEQEAKVIAGLEHPSILPVHDYGESDGYTYLVMRYISGGTLAGLMVDGVLDSPRVYRILSQVAAALDHAHSRAVIHRDIKPSNVLVDDQGNCFLTDFGIAKMLEAATRLTVTGGFVGTPTYASPEQCLGRDLDGRSDVYSLGVMLYEMVTGRLPFDAETPMAVAIKQIHDPLPLPTAVSPRVSQSVERVILKALAKEPGDRYGAAGEMVRALAEAMAAEPKPVPSAAPTLGPGSPVDETVLYGAPPVEPVAPTVQAPLSVNDGAPAETGSATFAGPPVDDVRAQADVREAGGRETAEPAVASSQPAIITTRTEDRHHRRRTVPVWAWILLGGAVVALMTVAAIGIPPLLGALEPSPPTPSPPPTHRASATEPTSDTSPPNEVAGLGTHERPLVLASYPRPEWPESVRAIERVAGLVGELSGVAIRPAIVPHSKAVLEMMLAKEAHAGWLEALEYLAARERTDAEPAIVSVRFGSPRNQGQFVTRFDSGIGELPQLRGRIVCFGPRESMSGSIVPRLMLRGIGIDPGSHLAGDPPLDSHRQVILSVYHGECDAGASFVDARATVEDEFPDVWEDVIVLDTTVAFPSDSLAFAGRVPAEIRERVVHAFFVLLEMDEGRSALEEGYGFEGLEPIDDSAYHPLREQIAVAEAPG